MAIFIGDKPAQMMRETGRLIDNIQKEYQAEKLRREEYVNQYDAAESDYASFRDEFKPILSQYVKDIMDAQVAVEETNSSEARDKLRNLSRDYERAKGIAQGWSEVYVKGINDARNGLTVEDEKTLAGQAQEGLADLKGMSRQDFLTSKYADPSFQLLRPTSYDKSIEGMNIDKHVKSLMTVYGNREGDIYGMSGNLNKDKVEEINTEFVDLMFKSQPELLKSAATRYANRTQGTTSNEVVTEIMRDPELLEKAKAEFSADIIEGAQMSLSAKRALSASERAAMMKARSGASGLGFGDIYTATGEEEGGAIPIGGKLDVGTEYDFTIKVDKGDQVIPLGKYFVKVTPRGELERYTAEGKLVNTMTLPKDDDKDRLRQLEAYAKQLRAAAPPLPKQSTTGFSISEAERAMGKIRSEEEQAEYEKKKQEFLNQQGLS
tara:strand:+ start:103 stop:1407 length:1305 start_codon:yes stop_codon:yes gene_type:complete